MRQHFNNLMMLAEGFYIVRLYSFPFLSFSISVSLCHFLFLLVGLHKGSGSHDHFCPCLTTCQWARPPTDAESRALTLTLAAPKGSHVQQDIDIALASPRPSAPFPWFETDHVSNLELKTCDKFSSDGCFSAPATTCVQRSAGRKIRWVALLNHKKCVATH